MRPPTNHRYVTTMNSELERPTAIMAVHWPFAMRQHRPRTSTIGSYRTGTAAPKRSAIRTRLRYDKVSRIVRVNATLQNARPRYLKRTGASGYPGTAVRPARQTSPPCMVTADASCIRAAGRSAANNRRIVETEILHHADCERASAAGQARARMHERAAEEESLCPRHAIFSELGRRPHAERLI